MENKERSGVLSIETIGDASSVKIDGTKTDVMFNWIALTHQVCKAIPIRPAVLAAAMPILIEEYVQKDLKGEFHTNPPGERK